ncbi:MFS transporter [Bacillus mesophilum]|uniref:MFS transporter n=1 Tax=Bacillus mesophilum TaxID=1071718 RepID=A0A7V7RJ42_9BACI|nr:MFS transporter [Bacillus mesophilum]KAB2330657.1 MFS transporter [Bacillus mesophilum]
MLSLFKEEKEYRKLFSAGVLNGIGDRFSQVAVLALLLELTGSGFAVGLTLAIRVIPFLLFAPLGGWLSDKFSKRSILVLTDLIRIFFALSFLFVKSPDQVWIIYVGTFILGAGEAIYAPARKSIIPIIVNQYNLVKVNSLEQVMIGFILIGGSLSGGVASYYLGPNITFGANAVSFLLAALILSRMQVKKESVNEIISESTQRENTIAFLFSSSLLLLLLGSEFLIPLLNGIDNVLISVYAVEEFHLGDLGVGIFYGSLGIGLMLSFIVGERLHNHLLIIGFSVLIFEGLFLIILSEVHSVSIAVLVYITIGFCAGVGGTCFDSTLMKIVPKNKQGSVFGLFATISNSMIGISMFGAGIALEYADNRWLGMLGGAGFMIAGVLLLAVYLSLKNNKDKMPSGRESDVNA